MRAKRRTSLNLNMTMASRHNTSLRTTLKPKISTISSMRVTLRVTSMVATMAMVDSSVAMVALQASVATNHSNDHMADTLTHEETVDMTAFSDGEQT